jgi:hypothetical protein
MQINLHQSCKDCGITLHTLFPLHIDGRCYKCHTAHGTKGLREQIEKLEAENKELKEANTLPGFFVVVRGDDDRLYRHSTEYAAKQEAERLAGKNPGFTFFVLGTSAAYRKGFRPDKVTVVNHPEPEILNEDDVPF